MKKILLKYFLLLLFSIIISCDEEFIEVREFPVVTTEQVSEITPAGATLQATVTLRKNPQIELHGFVWSGPGTLPSVGGPNEEVKLSGPPKNNQFSARISAALKKGDEYTVRAFVIANEIIVYGETVKFVSLGSEAPFIKNYDPKSGTWGDTISFYGKNFSTQMSQNEVSFGEAKATIIFATDTLLRGIVPAKFNGLQADVNVSVSGNLANKLEKFTYPELKINLVSPLTATFGDTLTILGNNIHTMTSHTSVFIDGLTTIFSALSHSEIKVIVPQALNKSISQIKIVSTGQELVYPQSFVLKQHKIHRIEPDTITRQNQTITIYGENFSPVLQNNRLLYEGYYVAQVIESSNTHIKVILPSQIINKHHISEFKDFDLELRIGNSVAKETLFLKWNSTWTRKNDFPGEVRAGAIAFSIMNVGYYGTGTNNNWMDHKAMKDFWQYDDKSDTWNQLPDYPGGGTQNAASFSLNDKGYILGGTQLINTVDGLTIDHKLVFMRFDPVTKNWESIAPYPGKGVFGLTGIAMDNTALVGAGSRIPVGEYNNFTDHKDFWIYTPADNSWKATTSLDHNTTMSPGFFAGNKAYLHSTDGLYRLGPSKWQRFPTLHTYSQKAISFVIGKTGYFGLGSIGVAGSSALWAYDTENDRLISYLSPTHLYHSSAFVVNNRAYIIGGISSHMPTKTVWEFDPSKPEP